MQNRGRVGGPGPCGNGETGDWGKAGRAEHQGGSEDLGLTGAHQGGAGVTGAHQGGAGVTGAHQGGAGVTGAHQGGAEDHQSQTEDHHGGTDRVEGTEDHGKNWDLGNTETHKTDRVRMAPRVKAGNTTSSSVISLMTTEQANSS